MKKTLILLTLSLTASLTSCRSNRHFSEIVKEVYMHKYDVPVTKSDWEAQGKDGKIISQLKDGITVAASYSHGILEGPTTYTFPNSSTIHYVEIYSEGQLTSRKENFASGVPLKEEIYAENTLVKLTRWYEDGTPQITETYTNNLLVTGEYRTPLNVVDSRVSHGNGTRILRSGEGELVLKDTIYNGQMIERVSYHSNGDPATITSFDNGMVHGKRLTFLQGGLPNTVEQWIHGVQEGITFVYQNGEKVAQVPYVQGKKNGIEYRYKDGEFLVEEVHWKNNLQHGQRKIYVDGVPTSEWYHHGELVSRTTFERMNMPRKSA